ncbi:MAG: DUF4175 family protein [Myxococcales bacterium]|nr:DUF4175 family protein [Myxococcales bacterium]
MRAAERRLHRSLARLRRRAWLVHGLGLLAWIGGAALPTFALVSFVAGPAVGWGGALLAWLVVALAALAAAYVGARPLRGLRGAGAARLLHPHHPDLASMARSAAELGEAPHGAPELVAAHLALVDQRLGEVPSAVAAPWSALREPRILGALVLAVGALSATWADPVSAGAFALLHPGARDEGLRLADVIARIDVELAFPAYLGREPARADDDAILEVPRGTTVRWTMRPRLPIARAELDVVGAKVRLEPGPEGAWTGRFIVRESGVLRVDVRDLDGRDLRDATPRSVRALVDDAPRVDLLEPIADRMVELTEPIALGFAVADDHGLAEVTLVLDAPSGEQRRPLPVSSPTAFEGFTRLSAVELGVMPGDTISVHVEAKDRDDVFGPNVGRSETRRFTVASASSRRTEAIESLEASRDAALTALADRLESPPPAEDGPARERHLATRASSERYAEGLARLAESEPDGFEGRPFDRSVLASMARSLGRKLSEEGRLFGATLGPRARRVSSDEGVVEMLEDQTLFLDDLLARARLDDASAIARELEQLRREMASLLAELRRTDSPEARERLMAAMRRAQARMRELAARVAAMGEDVPGEFLNADSLPQAEAEDALRSLDEAVQSGDLDAAERALLELERQIDALARAFGSAEEGLAEARFGPRERAMAEAMDALVGLEAEQRGLAERTETVQRETAQRAMDAAGEAAGAAARELAESAGRARGALGQMPGDALGPYDREVHDRVSQRLRDVEDTLRAGDLGEARRMAAEARDDAAALARDLEISALMFGGRRGQVAEAAREARRAADATRELAERLDDAIPRLGDHLEAAGRDQLRDDAPRQSEARDAARRLAEQFRSEPDGQPLSPESAEAMDAIERAMEQAERTLRRGEPNEATRAQQEASRRLTELRETLEQDSQSSGQGGEGGGEGMSQSSQQRVSIPVEGDARSAHDRRRRVLDGMRRAAPRGYEEAVRRYYEELLR